MAEGESATRDIHIPRAGGTLCSKACGHGAQPRNAEKMRTEKQERLSFPSGNSMWRAHASSTDLNIPLPCSYLGTGATGKGKPSVGPWCPPWGRERQKAGRGKRSSDFPKPRADSAAASFAARDGKLGSGKGDVFSFFFLMNNFL